MADPVRIGRLPEAVVRGLRGPGQEGRLVSVNKEYWLDEQGRIVWRVPDIREAVRAPAGRKLAVADYSQIELRIMAWLSQDPFLLGAISSGKDVHSYMACDIFGYEYEEFVEAKENPEHPLHRKYKSIRSNVKTTVFGCPLDHSGLRERSRLNEPCELRRSLEQAILN